MPLMTVDATEDVIPEMMRIEDAAPQGSMVEKVLFPDGRSPELLEIHGQGNLKQAREHHSVRNIKVIDTDHEDEVIAFIRWQIYFGEKTQYIKTNMHSTSGQLGADPADMALWNRTVRRKRIEPIGSTPHCCETTTTRAQMLIG